MPGYLNRVMERRYPQAKADIQTKVPLLFYLHIALLVFLLLTLATVLVFTSQEKLPAYLLITVLSVVTVTASLVLNLKGSYAIALPLTIGIMFVGPWASITYEQLIRSGDYIPMIFTIIPVQVAALFLATKPMLIISAAQTIALINIILFSPNRSTYNWESLVCYVFIASLLSTVTSYVIRSQYAKLLLSKDELTQSKNQLRVLSITDPLSGLYNRRYMEEMLSSFIQFEQNPFALFMVDVDHFKNINDTYGHTKGDRIIQAVANVLLRCVRKSDVACRFGGDEFLVILQDCPLDGAMKKATEIQQAIHATIFVNSAPETSAITVSIGLVMFPDGGTNAETLLRAADNALYRAKEEGRNRIVVHTP